MANRITFRGRGRGCAVSDGVTPPAVSIVEPRVKYIPGEITTGTPSTGKVACGPGTNYPVPATIDQIFEIFCRARNTIISGGEWTAEHETEAYRIKYTGSFNTSSPPTHNYYREQFSVDGWAQSNRRGYAFSAESTNKGWLEHHCGPAYSDFFSSYYGDYHDAEDEFCMWPDSGVIGLPIGYNQGIGIQSGANHLIQINAASPSSGPSVYGPYVVKEERTYSEEEDGSISYYDETFYLGGMSDFVFSPRVAFIGGSSPFDPGVTLYPAISWRGSNVWSFNSYFGAESSNGSAEVVLSSDTLLIPIRVSIPDYPVVLTSSPRLTVTEWWPYKTTAGSPAWDAATGLPINGGPGA